MGLSPRGPIVPQVSSELSQSGQRDGVPPVLGARKEQVCNRVPRKGWCDLLT
jgi:hypothetical protein